ncbi:MAG: hypothetical protein AAGA67_06670 [Cyanobacteria bacterium P01_F01_bin.153]
MGRGRDRQIVLNLSTAYYPQLEVIKGLANLRFEDEDLTSFGWVLSRLVAIALLEGTQSMKEVA